MRVAYRNIIDENNNTYKSNFLYSVDGWLAESDETLTYSSNKLVGTIVTASTFTIYKDLEFGSDKQLNISLYSSIATTISLYGTIDNEEDVLISALNVSTVESKIQLLVNGNLDKIYLNNNTASAGTIFYITEIIISDNIVELTASTEIKNYPIENVQNDHLNKVWKSDTGTTQTVLVELNTYPELPDDPAGVSQKYDGFTSASTVTAGTGCTISLEGSRIKITITASNWFCTFPVLATSIQNKHVRIIYQSSHAGVEIRLYSLSGGTTTRFASKTVSTNQEPIDGYNSAASNRQLMINCAGWTSGDILYLDAEYIGTGAYLSPTLDTSGNGNHLTNTAAVPVDYNGRKWWYGNGATTGLYNSSVAIPDIVHFHCRAIPTASSSAKIFIVWGATAAHLGAFRNASNTELIVRYPRASDNATLAISSFFTEGAETVLDIEWNFTAQTISVKRDSVVVQEYSGLTTMVKPSGTALYLMRSFSGSYFLGYYTEAYITNKSLTAAQIRDLYYNGFSEHLLKKAVAAYSLDYNLLVNTIAILGHNINSGSNIAIKANDTNDFTSPSFSTSLTWNKNIILYFLANAINYKYWQFSFTGLINALEIGRLWLGTYLDISPSSLNDFTVNYNSIDLVQHNTYRQKFAEEITNYRAFELSFPKTENDMIIKLIDFYNYSSKYRSFIFCNFDTNRDYELIEPCYCSINNNLDFSHINRMGFEYDLEFIEDK